MTESQHRKENKLNIPIDWLLEGTPWVRYRVFRDLLSLPETAPEVIAARKTMIENAQIKSLVADVSSYPGEVLRSHKTAGHILHKLAFLAEIGVQSTDPGMERVTGKMYTSISHEGIPELVFNIAPRYGGSGKNQNAWMLCDAPLLLYALASFCPEDSTIREKPREFLVTLLRENGFPCAVSPALGKFRGPGRKSDPCPYANLLMLQMLSLTPDKSKAAIKTAGETLLSLWEIRREKRPYLFAMGTDFTKLKAPLIWYDILHFLDVFTRFPFFHNDPRLAAMLELLQTKADSQGHFTAESVWRAWKGWEFGQKREPSKWISFLAYRILARLDPQLVC